MKVLIESSWVRTSRIAAMSTAPTIVSQMYSRRRLAAIHASYRPRLLSFTGAGAPRAPQRGCRVGDPARSARTYADASPRIHMSSARHGRRRVSLAAGAIFFKRDDEHVAMTRPRWIERRDRRHAVRHAVVVDE